MVIITVEDKHFVESNCDKPYIVNKPIGRRIFNSIFKYRVYSVSKFVCFTCGWQDEEVKIRVV